MIKYKCKYCKKIFENYPSRKSIYCSLDCSILSNTRLPNNLFDIESYDACYWLGFLFGDGCVDTKGKLQICLSIKDIDHLYKFNNFIFSRNINAVNKYKDRCIIQVNSKNLCKNLEKYNIIPNKTKTSLIVLPQSKYINHFIRGLFDADGWVFKKEYKNNKGYKYYKYCCGICSYLKENLEIINNQLPIHGIISRKKTQELYELRFQSKQDIRKIKTFLYQDSLTSLHRKRILMCSI